MIKHIVFWRMKKEANGNDMYENIRIAAEKLDAVAKQFPALKSLTHHTCIFSGAHYWDYVEEYGGGFAAFPDRHSRPAFCRMRWRNAQEEGSFLCISLAGYRGNAGMKKVFCRWLSQNS